VYRFVNDTCYLFKERFLTRSLVMGIFMVIGGASGKLVLIGTNSSTALVIVGVVVAAFGLFQMLAGKKTEAVAPNNAESMGIKK
jgi:uncharacterized membrane protein YfcA